MRLEFWKICLTFAVVFFSARFAFALPQTTGYVHYTTEFQVSQKNFYSRPDNFDEFIDIAKFNPTLGALTSVDIYFIGTVLTNFTYSNISIGTVASSEAFVTGTLNLNIGTGTNLFVTKSTTNPWSDFGLLNITPGSTVVSSNTPTLVLPTVIDPNASNYIQSSKTSSTQTFNTPSNLALYTGSGVYSINAFKGPFLYGDLSSVDDPAVFNNFYDVWVQEDVYVRYNYDDAPVPEPGTMMLMGSGLLLFGGRAFYRSRRNRIQLA